MKERAACLTLRLLLVQFLTHQRDQTGSVSESESKSESESEAE